MLDAPVYKLNAWHKAALIFCRAYVRRAKVLFIDNVLDKLDIASRKEAFYRFVPLLSCADILIYATDSLEEASFLSDKIHYLHCGYLLQTGTFAELHDTPACAAAYLSFHKRGTLLSAVIEEGALRVFDVAFPFDTSRLIGQNYIGAECLLGVSPEDLVLSDNGFTAEIDGRFYGKNTYIYAIRRGEDLFYWATDREFSVGERVTLALLSAKYVFDGVNERLIVRN